MADPQTELLTPMADLPAQETSLRYRVAELVAQWVGEVDDRKAQVLALKHAVLEGRQADAEQILRTEGFPLEKNDEDAVAVLFAAIEAGWAGVVRQLLRWTFVDVNQVTRDNMTPLGLAVHKGRLDVVTELWGQGANVHQADGHGDTPVLLAQREGNLKMVEVLVAYGAIRPAQPADGAPAEARNACGFAAGGR